ncbi:MAG: hypothetical protein ACYDDZ_10930 [Acidimicrobiales bacterium]
MKAGGRRIAFWMTVAGVSLVSPYVLGVLAAKVGGPVATLNNDLKAQVA